MSDQQVTLQLHRERIADLEKKVAQLEALRDKTVAGMALLAHRVMATSGADQLSAVQGLALKQMIDAARDLLSH